MARKKRSFQSINKTNKKKIQSFTHCFTEKGNLSRNPYYYCSHNRIAEIFACESSTIGKWLMIRENDLSVQLKKKHSPKWLQLEGAIHVVWLERIIKTVTLN